MSDMHDNLRQTSASGSEPLVRTDGESEADPARIAQFEAAIADLQAAGLTEVEASRGEQDDPAEAIARIEQRLEEQEQTLRHVLSMLIEWLEVEGHNEASQA